MHEQSNVSKGVYPESAANITTDMHDVREMSVT